jgi:Nucleotidyl transferase AbiEii toxin, Type IV TA system
MLRKETVSSPLLESLAALMEMKTIKAHRLVGGTALALQIGHRISLDIDLFSDEENDYEQVQEDLYEKFGSGFKKGRYVSSSISKGIAVYLNNVKTDILDWKAKFIRPALIDEKVRMACKEDIIPMKFNTFLCSPELARYEKRNYVDIAQLMKEYPLDEMISLYHEKYPNELLSSRQMIEGLQLSELADKKVMPKMLIAETWQDVKAQIQKCVDLFIESQAMQ